MKVLFVKIKTLVLIYRNLIKISLEFFCYVKNRNQIKWKSLTLLLISFNYHIYFTKH